MSHQAKSPTIDWEITGFTWIGEGSIIPFGETTEFFFVNWYHQPVDLSTLRCGYFRSLNVEYNLIIKRWIRCEPVPLEIMILHILNQRRS